MPATLDAAALVEMGRNGDFPGCRVLGPLALDNAISVEAARHKGITDPDAGRADILLVPYIEVGNVLYKSLAFLAGAANAGILVGAAAPIVLTSRGGFGDGKTEFYCFGFVHLRSSRRLGPRDGGIIEHAGRKSVSQGAWISIML